MAQLIPLPLTVSCSSKIQIGFTFLISAHLGSPGQRAIKRVCVCVCVKHRLTAKNRDQLRNHTLGNRVWATFTFTFFINDMNNKSSMTKQSQNQDQLPLDTRYHFVHKALNKKLKALSENVNNRALLSSFHADQSINL